jgi:methyltransferase-like protein 6
MAEGHTDVNKDQELKITFYDKPKVVPKYWQEKYDKDAAKYWDKFYLHNTTHFFKDRHWIVREFPELNGTSVDQSTKSVLDIGCGVGNTMFPVLEVNPNLFFWAIDFSPRAISLLKENPVYNEEKCKPFVLDVTKDPLPAEVANNSVDYATLIFVLSAIAPEMMDSVIAKVHKVSCDNAEGSRLFVFVVPERDSRRYQNEKEGLGISNKN